MSDLKNCHDADRTAAYWSDLERRHRGHSAGWKCSKLDCETSSLVRSNFKFDRHGRAWCAKCWPDRI